MKRCSSCRRDLEDSSFTKNRSMSDGLARTCRECHSAYVRRPEVAARMRTYAVRYRDDRPRERLLSACRDRAKKKGWSFNLTLDDIIIPERCPVLGIPLRLYRERRRAAPDIPSVDRIDPGQGYVKGNIIVVSWRANNLRRDATPEELRTVADFYARLSTFPPRP